MVTFRIKNVDLPFKNGDMFAVSFEEYLEMSRGVISTLAEHMDISFKHEFTTDGWYKVTFKKK